MADELNENIDLFEPESEEDIETDEKVNRLTIFSEMNDIHAYLKSILASPRMFLAKHFSDLISEVDLSYEKFMKFSSNEESNLIVPSQANRQLEIVDKIKDFETECFERLMMNDALDYENIEKVVLEAESKMSDTLWFEIYATWDQIEKMGEMMYQCLVQAQKILFGNNSIIFWKKQDVKHAKIDSFGNLLLVRGEFIGNRAIKDFK